ncbi:MAG TPA: hypothetical protein VHD90_14550 [Phototrophicaceae bacterium]|nr:hypothetical protein [Phototrophicaceae bacterium]
MSWIVGILKLKKDVQSIKDVESEDFLIPLGTKAEIIALLRKWFPDADFHDLSWIGSDRRGEFTEIIVSGVNELNDDDSIDSFGFRNPSYRLLRDVCTKMGWKALDPSDGDFIDFTSLTREYLAPMYFPKDSQPAPATYTLVDFIAYLRNQIMETYIKGNTNELRNLAVTLQTLGDSVSLSGNHTYWRLIDSLAYFARHSEIADYMLYVPTEAAIRELEPK